MENKTALNIQAEAAPIINTNTSFDWMAMMCLVYPKMQFALLAARAQCWLMLSLLSTNTPRCLFSELLSSHSSLSLHLQVQSLVFSFVNFVSWMIALCYNTSRSFWKASCPSRVSTVPPSIVSANLQRMCSTTASRSLLKMLSRTDPWGTPLVTCHQPDVAPFTTIFWALLLS